MPFPRLLRALIPVCVSLAPLLHGYGAAAADLKAGPHTLRSVMAHAHGGDRIILAPGSYGRLEFVDQTWSPAVVIDGKAASFSKIDITRSHGIYLQGATIQSSGGRVHAVDVSLSSNAGVSDASISHARAGIVIDRSRHIRISGNALHGMSSDGIDVALSRNVVIENNHCFDFSPRHAIYDVNGVRIADGDHPDCIQGWSRPTEAPVSDITIEGNTAEGDMQGIGFFNHVRNGVDDGGFDRIVIRNNRIKVTMPQGIALTSGRNSVVTGNTVSSIPGSTLAKNGHPVKTAINVSGTSNQVCGNAVSDVPRSPAARTCD